MKKIIAIIFLAASGMGLLVPDPVPFIDEGILIMVALNSLAYLGLDVRKLFGVKGKDFKKAKAENAKEGKDGQTIDV